MFTGKSECRCDNLADTDFPVPNFYWLVGEFCGCIEQTRKSTEKATRRERRNQAFAHEAVYDSSIVEDSSHHGCCYCCVS